MDECTHAIHPSKLIYGHLQKYHVPTILECTLLIFYFEAKTQKYSSLSKFEIDFV